MMKQNNNLKKGLLKIVPHIVTIMVVLVFPVIIGDHNFNGEEYVMSVVVLLFYAIIFYVNYFILIDKWFYKKHKLYLYILVNITIVISFWMILEFWREMNFEFHAMYVKDKSRFLPPPPPKKYIIAMRDIWLGILIIGLSIALRVSENYHKLRQQTLELLKLRSETELAELKQQLNPHFLFNTLNNIYSLISISQVRAQQAVHDLSNLLRYVLNEGSRELILLETDLQFIRNYIDLMALRLGKEVNLSVNIPHDASTFKIAPMLFVLLVENAFKHIGTNVSEPLIQISIIRNKNCVLCSVKNTFVESNSDFYDFGIGLENLQKRLLLLYPDKHKYSVYKKGNIYNTDLEVELYGE